jgi:hypothetical protein
MSGKAMTKHFQQIDLEHLLHSRCLRCMDGLENNCINGMRKEVIFVGPAFTFTYQLTDGLTYRTVPLPIWNIGLPRNVKKIGGVKFSQDNGPEGRSMDRVSKWSNFINEYECEASREDGSNSVFSFIIDL